MRGFPEEISIRILIKWSEEDLYPQSRGQSDSLQSFEDLLKENTKDKERMIHSLSLS